MEYRQLPHGNANEKFSVLGLGMGGIGKTPVDEIEAIIRKAIDHGINFFDLCTAGASYAPIGRAIKDYSVFGEIVRKLGSIGYIHEGDLSIQDREAFKYADKPHLMTHHLYVCPRNSEELHRHIVFRDFLRKNPEAVKKYSRVKETAAQLFPDSIDQYIEYKSPCIEELYKECGLK